MSGRGRAGRGHGGGRRSNGNGSSYMASDYYYVTAYVDDVVISTCNERERSSPVTRVLSSTQHMSNIGKVVEMMAATVPEPAPRSPSRNSTGIVQPAAVAAATQSFECVS